MSSPEGSPPPTRTENAEEICPRCKDLDLRNLLGPAPALDHGRRAITPHRNRRLSKEDMKMYEIKRKHEILRGTRILQRLAFEEENPPQQHCQICKRIREWKWVLPIKSFGWRRLDNSSITAPRKEFKLWMKDEGPSVVLKWRSPLRFQGGKVQIDFGIGPHLESSQRLLPMVHITGETLDYSKIKGWLHHCLAQHPRCKKPNIDELTQIPGFRLFDINRRCLVPYTEGDAFVALSYVWGNVYSSPEAASLSPDTTDHISQTYPLTIEHAILIVRNTGYQFMWVDSICIDQKNNEEKMQQIERMHIIYSSATATLIPLHSPYARYGIPGVVQDHSQGALKHERLSQIEARLGTDGDMVVHSYHPPLHVELQDSVWRRRGWTYQEGLLSQRRILVTRHQVHFVCNEMHCSEDNPDSWPMNTDVLGGLVNPLTPDVITSPQKLLFVYCEIVRKFTHRLLTNQDDSLNAVSAVLAALQIEALKDGFIYGIPRHGFRNALLWIGQGDMIPSANGVRVTSESRMQFPTWSWCGWEQPANVWFETFTNWNTTHCLNPPLWISWNEQPIITRSNRAGSTKEFGYENIPSAAYEDPIWRLVEDLWRKEAMKPTLSNTRFETTALRVKGILLSLPFVFRERKNGGLYLDCTFPAVGSVTKDVELQSLGTEGQVVYYDCLLLTMSACEYVVNFKGILLLWDTKGHNSARGVATRAGHVDYQRNKDRFEKIWHDLNPRIEEFWFL